VILSVVITSLLMPIPLSATQVRLVPPVVQPGESFVIHIIPELSYPVAEIRASVLGKEVRLYQVEKAYKGLAPVDAGATPGEAAVYVKVFYGNDRCFQETLFVRIAKKEFPKQSIRMNPTKTSLMDPELLRQERELLYSYLLASFPRPLWSGTFISPCAGRIVSSFGRRRYVNGKWWGQHSGADIASPAGTPVKAANSGIVVFASLLRMRGNTVVIDHGFNVFSLYNHLSAIKVKAGEQVRKGSLIGAVGATGFASGPHLHWEIRIGTVPVNPWTWTKSVPRL